MSIAKHDFERFMNQARVHLPGASDAGTKSELFDVLHEFFNDSSCWTENINIPIVANVVDYTVTPAADGQIIRLAGVVDANNIPQPALMPTVGVVSLRDTPNSAQTFTATVIKNVVLPTSREMIPVAPDWLFPIYARTILDGLLGRMMSQPNKSYTNDKMGQYHLRRFITGISMARTAALRRNTLGSQAWAFPQQFRTRGQRGGVSTVNNGF